MQRTNTKKGRFYHGGIIPEGEHYPSVTSILTAIGKPQLVPWAAKMEREMVIEAARALYESDKALTGPGFVLSLQAALGAEKAHVKELEKAGHIGSSIHELIEWSLRMELLEDVGKSPILSDQAQWAFAAFQKWRQTVKLKALCVERFVCCHCHRIAGTVDLIATLDGQEAVLDWKSGRKVYWESKLQNAAYRHCVREMGIANPKRGLIVRFPKIIGDPEFEPVDAGDEEYYFERFLHVKDVWETMQKEEAA
jgi:PD-(D/E)XK nuclease superfamily